MMGSRIYETSGIIGFFWANLLVSFIGSMVIGAVICSVFWAIKSALKENYYGSRRACLNDRLLF
jgi:uncharacterized membrane-anchored protein YitT (DUF2179 family)